MTFALFAYVTGLGDLFSTFESLMTPKDRLSAPHEEDEES
ncbi:hypothetical protein MJ1HA_1061 [Metallosphaera sedula]|nr:hypothetical protein MJ1HA_1061 [Metallosphaera sedula]